MKNLYQNKKRNTDTLQVHVDQPPIPLIKINNDDKLDKYSVKIKLRRDPMSEKSDLYEFKMTMFDNGEPEEFLFFIQSLNMTIEAPGTLKAGSNIQYLCTLVNGEALHQFDTFYAEV